MEMRTRLEINGGGRDVLSGTFVAIGSAGLKLLLALLERRAHSFGSVPPFRFRALICMDNLCRGRRLLRTPAFNCVGRLTRRQYVCFYQNVMVI